MSVIDWRLYAGTAAKLTEHLKVPRQRRRKIERRVAKELRRGTTAGDIEAALKSPRSYRRIAERLLA